MKDFFNKTFTVLKGMVSLFKEKDPVVYSAAVAFFTIFSMPSIIIVIISLSRVLQKDAAVESKLVQQIRDLIGEEGSEVALTIIDNISTAENYTFATLLSIVILFISATAIFNFIQKGLNSIWGVKPKPEKGLVKFLTDRLLSLSLIIIWGFLLLITLVVDTLFNVIRKFISEYFNEFTSLIMMMLNLLLSFSIFLFIFLLFFKFLPDAIIRWKDAFIGAVVTAALFSIGKFVIAAILAKADLGNVYAAAGSLAGVLIWVFYSSILLFLGGIFTKVYSDQLGTEIVPSKAAVRVERRETKIEDK